MTPTSMAPLSPLRRASAMVLATSVLCAVGAAHAQEAPREQATAAPAVVQPPPPPPPRAYFDAGQQDLSSSDKRMIGIPIAVGLPVLMVGLWAVTSPRSDTRTALRIVPDLHIARANAGMRAGLLLRLSL